MCGVEVVGVACGVGDQPVGQLEKLRFPLQQLACLATVRGELVFFVDLLVVGTDERVEHQRNAVATGVACGGGKVALAEAGNPDEFGAWAAAQAVFDVGRGGQRGQKARDLAAQAAQHGFDDAVARIVGPVVAVATPDQHLFHAARCSISDSTTVAISPCTSGIGVWRAGKLASAKWAMGLRASRPRSA